ncbi:MAG: hypothetical protein ABDH21_01815 [bacterium]
MDDQTFKIKLKEIIEAFSSEDFELAIKKAEDFQKELQNQDEKIFVKNIIKIITAANLVNQQKLEESLQILESCYLELKNYSPTYKGLKVENLLQSVNQSIADIKAIIKK